MKTSTVPQRKKTKKVTLPCTNVTGHLLDIERTFDDNMFQNAVAQFVCEICDEEGWQLKQVLKAFMKPAMDNYLKSLEEASFVEVEPVNVHVEPQMGDVAVCGLEPHMVGEAWGVLCKATDFKS